MPTIVKTFDTFVSVNNRREDLKTLNKYWLDDEDCNTYDEVGTLVSKYPNHPNLKDHRDATYTFYATHLIKITVNLMSDGTLQLAE